MAALALAVALMAWFLSGLEWDETKAVLVQADWRWLLASAALLLFEYVLRSWRWYYLVQDLDPDVRFRDLLSATNVGAAFNSFLPLRGGDFIRIAVLARRRKQAFTAVLSTTLVEKLLDAFGTVIGLLLLLYLLPADVASGGPVGTLKSAGGWLGVIALVLLVVTLLLGTRGAQAGFYRMITPMPKRLRARVFEQFKALVAGLGSVSNPMRLGAGLFSTGVILFNGYLGVYCAFRAFNLDLPNISALFVEIAVFVSVAVPQAPGFVGLFQVVLEEVMGLWGASIGAAQAMAIVLWGLYFVPVTVVGTIEALREGQGLREFRKELFESFDEAEERAEAPD